MIIFIEEASEKLVSFCNKMVNTHNQIILIRNGINKEQLETFLKIKKLDKSQCIWIVTDKSQAQTAEQAKIAATGEPDAGTRYAVESLREIDEEYLDKVRMRYNNIPWTIGFTKRCRIRELSLDDIPALYRLYEKPGITEFVEPLYEPDREIEYEKDYIKYVYGYYEYGMWLIFDRQNQKLIGRAGLNNREYDGESVLELGYIIAPEYQRQGYATEICRFIIDYAWENTEFDRLCCFIEPENIKSAGLAQKLGFEKKDKVVLEKIAFDRWILKKNKQIFDK